MKAMSAIGRLVSALAFAGFLATEAVAVPVPVASPPPLASGFQVDWVQTDRSPHSIANAIDALNGTNGFNTLASTTEYRNIINLLDGDDPFAGGDPIFAVRVSGFINVSTTGDYMFIGIHDDGLLVRVGGEDVIVFDADTGIRETDSLVYTLAAGIYSFEAISWEQGGVFNLDLGWDQPNIPRAYIAGQHDATAIPEPLSLALFGAGLLGLAVTRRKRSD